MQKFIDERRSQGQTLDLEPIGKKAIGFYKKRFAAANYEKKEEHYDNDLATHFETIRRRAEPIEVTGEHPTLLLRIDFDEVSDLAHSIIERYERAEIDSVYIVFNEFKSVISQLVVVEKLLPIRKLGSHEITVRRRDVRREEGSGSQRPAHSSGGFCVGIARRSRLPEQGRPRSLRHCRSGLYLRPGTGETIPTSDAAVCDDANLSCTVGVGCGGACSAYDGNGCGDEERR